MDAKFLEGKAASPPTPSVDELDGLPFVLSMVAGSADVISFVGLGGLFVAHITGNLIIIAAHAVNGTPVEFAPVLAVPVFVAALVLVRVLVANLDERGIASLRPLLLLQFALLACFFAVAVGTDAHRDPDAPTAIAAAMLGVSAMATQNALVQVSVRGAPSTAVMTTNVTRFTMDAGEALLGRDRAAVLAARQRASDTWPAIVGFGAGAAAGAALYSGIGLVSLALPTGLALVALVFTWLRQRK